MIVFLVSGLWHGAAWTFVIWGGLHGLYMVGDVATKSRRDKLAQWLGLDRRPTLRAVIAGLITFSLVCLAWVFFKANSVSAAFLLLNNMVPLTNFDQLGAPWVAVARNPAQEMALSITLILLLEGIHMLQAQEWRAPTLLQRPVWFRWAAYLGLALAIMNLGITEDVPFIYFQF
jgi:alginate O-acetyltransferase complex protein AlgI